MSPFQWSGDKVAVQKMGPVHGTLQVPGSKSLTNRYLLLAALAASESKLYFGLESDDTRHMRACLSQLGTSISVDGDCWVVQPAANWLQPSEPLFAGNAGTAVRFLTPLLARLPFSSQLHGDERMAVRPIADLVDALNQLGAQIEYLNQPNCPPLAFVEPIKSGKVSVSVQKSSQYLSALLLNLPFAQGPWQIEVASEMVSETYVEMTLQVLAQYDVHWSCEGNYFKHPGSAKVPGQKIEVPADGSTASYGLALPLMVGGNLKVGTIDRNSQQGDLGLIDILAGMGAKIEEGTNFCKVYASPLKGVDVDMNTLSDVAPTLAVVATRATSPTTIRNIGHMRIKECDRIETLQIAFNKLGLKMESGPDWMRIYPGTCSQNAEVDPQDDHRMAMVFALLGLADGGVTIRDGACVSKTYPNFYSDFSNLFQGRATGK